MKSPWARLRDRAHGDFQGACVSYPHGFTTRGIRMFGEERSYFRYVVLGLVCLMAVGFYFMPGKA
jgi:hypothetical protein